MLERTLQAVDDRETSRSELLASSVGSEVAERVRSVIAAAENVATSIRHEAEQEAQARRREAEAQAQRYLEDAKRRADALVAERSRRIAELSDALVHRTEQVLGRLERAEQVKRQLESLVHTLGETAERLAWERGSLDPVPLAPEPMGAESLERPVSREPADEPGRSREPARSAPPEPGGPVAEREGAGGPPPHGPEAEAGEPSPREHDEASGDRAGSGAAGAPLRGVAEPEPAVETESSRTSSSVVEFPQPAPQAEGEEERADSPRRFARHDPGADREAADSQRRQAPDPNRTDELLSARLVALQMAVAGGKRGEVDAHLRRAFDITDTVAILDDVFGKGTSGDKRVIWPEPAGTGGDSAS